MIQGLLYGCRCVETTEKFDLPENPLCWKGTCHHNNPKLMQLADEFLSDGTDLRLFYVWGHSYEFDGIDPGRRWRTSAKMAYREDVWYATNGEIVLG